ncbi:MAG: CHAT domain-containing protein [Myxococcales bacterium]|nr:CHAT domain-containing protein [Myxococcales bacterium]
MSTDSAWVRKVLAEVLRTDADLDAFCLDRMPDVASRFSRGMDRIEKTNLILRIEQPETVLRLLRDTHRTATERAEALLAKQVATEDSKGVTPAGYRTAHARRRWSETDGLRRPVLTIELRRTDAGTIEPSYFLHPDDDVTARPEPISFRASRGSPVLGPKYVVDGLSGTDAINAVLDRGQEHLLEQHLTGKAALDAGAVLFEVLFPSDAHWQAVMLRVRGLPQEAPEEVMPTQEWLRLRICTAVPRLQSLPWRLLSWEGYFLADHNWTMELVPAVQVQTRVKLTVPCKLLIVAPQYHGMADVGTKRHLASLRSALCERLASWDSPLLWREVQTRKHLVGALSGMQPDVLYYFGHGSLTAGGLPSLELGGPDDKADPLLLSDLLRLLKDNPPQVVLLNGCMTGAKGFHGAGHQLVQTVPIVISQRTTAFSGHAAQLAQRFFQRFLLDGNDPALALHHLDDLYSRTDFQWSTTMFHTSYASCQVHTHQPPGPTKDAAKRLDRRDPKARVDDELMALKKSSSCRVHALLVCGAPGAEVDHFAWQCTDHLVRNKDRRLLRFELGELPPSGSPSFVAQLDLSLRRAVGADEGEALEHALSKRLRQPIDAFWIDFGTIRPGPDQAVPIRKWLSYCCDFLSAHCPRAGRIVASLGIELPSDELPEMESEVRAYQDELRQSGGLQAFRCDYLQPHASITEDDLHHFFDDSDNTSCPVRLRRKAAKLIFLRSTGAYAEAVKLIERGERERWDDSYFSALDPDSRKIDEHKKKRRIE